MLFPTNASGAGGGCCLAADQYNRRLEKSIGQFDVTHDFKAGFVYDLPFGKGRQFLDSRSGRLDSRKLGR